MKMDVDSILYIVITLAILIVSGLSGRKKKKAQMEAAQAQAAQRNDAYDMEDIEDVDEEQEPVPGNLFDSIKSASSSFTESSNPLERLEQILTGQVPQENQVPPPYESTEGESMEETIDEEAQILADIKKRNEEPSTYMPDNEKEVDAAEDIEPQSHGIPGLFENIDEIKKAIIYNEILNRKY